MYTVYILSRSTGIWHKSVEKSLRAAIALVYGLTTQWRIVSTKDCAILGRYNGQLYRQLTKRLDHNYRAFKSSIKRAERIGSLSPFYKVA